MENGVTGEQEDFKDVLGNDVQWVFSSKEGYCQGIKFFL